MFARRFGKKAAGDSQLQIASANEIETGNRVVAAPPGDDAIIVNLQRLSRNEPLETDGMAPALVEALSDLARTLRSRDSLELQRSVAFSMQASESMAAIARATGEVRSVDQDAQSMSAAVEQLDASIREINQQVSHLPMTRVVVAHRQETLDMANKVYILEQGTLRRMEEAVKTAS